MQKSGLVFVLLALALPRTVVAQDSPVRDSLTKGLPVQIGIRLTGLANFMHWQTSEWIDYRYQLRPFLAGGAGVVLREPMTNRSALEAGISVSQLGMAESVGRNYRPNQRRTSRSRSKYTMYVMPIHFLYPFNRRASTLNPYLMLGTNLFYTNTDDTNRFAVVTSTIVDIHTNDTTQITHRQRSLRKFSPTVVIGTGWQKRWSNRSAMDIRLTGSIGIASHVQTFLTVTVRNQDRYYAPTSSTNELVNRGTYVGVDVCYLFSFH